jgi:hypothetical protein
MLIVQGSRDAFGRPEELEPVLRVLLPTPTLHVVPGGDHSFKITRAGKPAQVAVYDAINEAIVSWIGALER